MRLFGFTTRKPKPWSDNLVFETHSVYCPAFSLRITLAVRVWDAVEQT
jgi:hypothetical protein